MTEDLRALLIPPQEARLRSRFGLVGAPLQLITSGWQRLVLAAPDCVFVFPRHQAQVSMVEREAEVLSALDLDFVPRLLGLHRNDGISPYPFLQITRLAGESYEAVEACLTFEEVATCLEHLGRRMAQWHQVVVPSQLAARPDYLDPPRVSDIWTRSAEIKRTASHAAELLAPHIGEPPTLLWVDALQAIAALEPTTVHGEVSDGQFLIDARMHVTGVVDWCGLHVSHPFRDLDFGADGYRICRFAQRWTELRRCIWRAYESERSSALPEWQHVNLFWCLLDATTLLNSGRVDARFGRALADLSAAQDDLL